MNAVVDASIHDSILYHPTPSTSFKISHWFHGQYQGWIHICPQAVEEEEVLQRSSSNPPPLSPKREFDEGVILWEFKILHCLWTFLLSPLIFLILLLYVTESVINLDWQLKSNYPLFFFCCVFSLLPHVFVHISLT